MEPAAFLVGQAWIIVSYLYFMVRHNSAALSPPLRGRQLSTPRRMHAH